MIIKNNKKAGSIIEVMVVLLVVVTSLTGAFTVYSNSIRLSTNIENKIRAISIAREGIEAVTNIRDTNWILFGADYENCWNTYNYDNTCIGSTTTDIPNGSGGYIVYRDGDARWMLQNFPTGNYDNATYKSNYRVGLDSSGFYSQSGSTVDIVPIFTREIKINYIEDTNGDTNINQQDDKIEVTSLVMWRDNSSTNIHSVEIKSILTNWKK